MSLLIVKKLAGIVDFSCIMVWVCSGCWRVNWATTLKKGGKFSGCGGFSAVAETQRISLVAEVQKTQTKKTKQDDHWSFSNYLEVPILREEFI